MNSDVARSKERSGEEVTYVWKRSVRFRKNGGWTKETVLGARRKKEDPMSVPWGDIVQTPRGVNLKGQ
jgi:hypothetical protein